MAVASVVVGATLPLVAGAAAGVSETEHDHLPTARRAGISGGVQVRTAQDNRLRPAAQLDRGGMNRLAAAFPRQLHSCVGDRWIRRGAGDPLDGGRGYLR